MLQRAPKSSDGAVAVAAFSTPKSSRRCCDEGAQRTCLNKRCEQHLPNRHNNEHRTPPRRVAYTWQQIASQPEAGRANHLGHNKENELAKHTKTTHDPKSTQNSAAVKNGKHSPTQRPRRRRHVGNRKQGVTGGWGLGRRGSCRQRPALERRAHHPLSHRTPSELFPPCGLYDLMCICRRRVLLAPTFLPVHEWLKEPRDALTSRGSWPSRWTTPQTKGPTTTHRMRPPQRRP